MNYKNLIQDTDILWSSSTPTGRQDCLCSRCKVVINNPVEASDPICIRISPAEGKSEYRYHNTCLFPATVPTVK